MISKLGPKQQRTSSTNQRHQDDVREQRLQQPSFYVYRAQHVLNAAAGSTPCYSAAVIGDALCYLFKSTIFFADEPLPLLSPHLGRCCCRHAAPKLFMDTKQSASASSPFFPCCAWYCYASEAARGVMMADEAVMNEFRILEL